MPNVPQQQQSDKGESAARGGPVNALAGRALKVLAARRAPGARRPEPGYLALLDRALREGSAQQRRDTVATMRAAGITGAMICDLYIPELARRLGRAWCEDTMSFADVTIVSARLQSLLRELASDHADLSPAAASAVVVMVVADRHHTLGAMVLTGQLRRMGVSVRLLLGHTTDEIANLLRIGSFDAVLISVALQDDLEDVRAMIETMRKASSRRCPLVVGGGITASPLDADTLAAMTGADHVTGDLREALAHCAAALSTGDPP